MKLLQFKEVKDAKIPTYFANGLLCQVEVSAQLHSHLSFLVNAYFDNTGKMFAGTDDTTGTGRKTTIGIANKWHFEHIKKIQKQLSTFSDPSKTLEFHKSGYSLWARGVGCIIKINSKSDGNATITIEIGKRIIKRNGKLTIEDAIKKVNDWHRKYIRYVETKISEWV